jgi:hypothetical protein
MNDRRNNWNRNKAEIGEESGLMKFKGSGLQANELLDQELL